MGVCGVFSDPPETPFFCQYLEHADGESQGTRVDLNVPKDASHRVLSDITLRLDLALGGCRRHVPKVAQNRSGSATLLNVYTHVNPHVEAAAELTVMHIAMPNVPSCNLCT